MLATIPPNQRVEAGSVVAGTRIIPLVIAEKKIADLVALCGRHGPVVEVRAMKSLRVGILTTGNEVFSGRIKDGFGPVVREKILQSGSEVMEQIYVSDSIEMISGSIRQLLHKGADLITVTGGMSVDPDDVTPAGIRAAGAEIVTYGVPVLPGGHVPFRLPGRGSDHGTARLCHVP